jgi:RNA polymerase sigma-70 factor (ECF subfamily)
LSVERDVEHADDIRVLLQHIHTMSEKYRTVIELRYWSGLTFGEIGKLIGEKETTVKVRHHRALKQLEIMLQKYDN